MNLTCYIHLENNACLRNKHVWEISKKIILQLCTVYRLNHCWSQLLPAIIVQILQSTNLNTGATSPTVHWSFIRALISANTTSRLTLQQLYSAVYEIHAQMPFCDCTLVPNTQNDIQRLNIILSVWEWYIASTAIISPTASFTMIDYPISTLLNSIIQLKNS